MIRSHVGEKGVLDADGREVKVVAVYNAVLRSVVDTVGT